MGSLRSGPRCNKSNSSSPSSTTFRAKVRPEATAALKKAEMQKKRYQLQSQSALLIQQQELALVRRKMDKEARMESLCLEEEVKYRKPNTESRTRGSHPLKYQIPKAKKDVFKYSYFPRTIKDWNNLSHDIVLANSLNECKVKLDSYF